jgi:hypothetical protein
MRYRRESDAKDDSKLNEHTGGINMEIKILLKSILIWFSICVLAILNGAFRNYVMTPFVGEKYSRPMSGITLCCLIFIVSLFFIPLLGKGLKNTYIQMGILWVLLTIIFETILGLMEKLSFKEMINAYNITTGDLWLIVVLFIGCVPIIIAKIKQII